MEFSKGMGWGQEKINQVKRDIATNLTETSSMLFSVAELVWKIMDVGC